MRIQIGLSLVTGLAVVTGAGSVSCSRVDCGDGTVERDGTCVPADESLEPGMCGPGTVLGAMGCEPEEPTQCDPATTIEQFDEETGITTCVGFGSGCSGEIPCEAPTGGNTSLCGRLWDTETDTLIPPLSGATGARCTTPTTDGPCSFDLKFYDALAFATDPTGAVPIEPPGGVYLDDCGRYKGINLAPTTFMFLGIGVDDAQGAPDRYRLTGVATAESEARPGAGFRAYATRITTDQTWTTSAGLGGMSFAQRGVLAVVFHRDDEANLPVAGVALRRGGTDVDDDEDFYFTDTGVARTDIADPVGDTSAVDVTGPNGTVLGIDAPQAVAHDGVGGLPAGCQWPSNLAAAIPGVVFVQIKHAEQPGGAACPP